MAGSRRLAGTVLGGRRRGKRPRSAKDGRMMDDRSDGVAGHGRRRTDRSTKCQTGSGLRRTVARLWRTANGCASDGNKVLRTETSAVFYSRGTSQRQDLSSRLLCTGLAKRNKPALCSRCCARQVSRAHTAVPWGFSQRPRTNMVQPKPPPVTGTCRDSRLGEGVHHLVALNSLVGRYPS